MDETFLFSGLTWLVLWTALFYSLVATASVWLPRLPLSSKEHENGKHWNAMQAGSFVHSVFISALSVPALFILATASSDAQYPPSEGLQPWCTLPGGPGDIADYQDVYYALATAGLAFTMHIVSDLFTSVAHGIATAPQIIHHTAFIVAGLIIRMHCALPFNSAVLMSMEASTPFLNVLMVLRNRGDQYTRAVRIASYFFIALFVVFRLVLNTYGLVILWINHETILPPEIPGWQAVFLLVAITAGALIQYFFFAQILQSFCGPARKSDVESAIDSESEETEESMGFLSPAGSTPKGFQRSPLKRSLSDSINVDGSLF